MTGSEARRKALAGVELLVALVLTAIGVLVVLATSIFSTSEQDQLPDTAWETLAWFALAGGGFGAAFWALWTACLTLGGPRPLRRCTIGIIAAVAGYAAWYAFAVYLGDNWR